MQKDLKLRVVKEMIVKYNFLIKMLMGMKCKVKTKKLCFVWQ